MPYDPFTPELLAYLLEADADRPTLLKRRESKTLELKVNFGLGEDTKVDYARTMAAFANREGGYLLFGIRDKPHVLDGLQNDRFDTFDPRTLSQFLQNHFSPNIDWQHISHAAHGQRFGIIYVAPAKRKPVVCIASNSAGKKLRDGDVFYRYQGETRLIGAAELHGIIEERIEQERQSWQDLLRRTAQVKPPSVAFLDLESGRLFGAEGSLMIGQDVLDKVKFIQEGHFQERGEPTLRVVGDVEVVRTEAIPIEQRVPIDPAQSHPHLQSAVIAQLENHFGQRVANGHDLLSVRRVFDVDNRPEWFYQNTVGQHAPQYSPEYVKWLNEQFMANPQFFREARARYKELLG